jgi:hypothetical protein
LVDSNHFVYFLTLLQVFFFFSFFLPVLHLHSPLPLPHISLTLTSHVFSVNLDFTLRCFLLLCQFVFSVCFAKAVSVLQALVFSNFNHYSPSITVLEAFLLPTPFFILLSTCSGSLSFWDKEDRRGQKKRNAK